MTQNIMERGPLKCSLVHDIKALDPQFRYCHRFAQEKQRGILNKLVDTNWREDSQRDEALHQFRKLLFVLERQFKLECENFAPETEGVKTFSTL